PLWCQAHHIIWWSNNGPTNLENLVLVCNDCHHKIHDDGWQVHKHPNTGKYQLKPPTHPSDKRPTTLSGAPSTPSHELDTVHGIVKQMLPANFHGIPEVPAARRDWITSGPLACLT
ncbi:MAG: HNH endonuclease, partial [Acidimicrobiaceae bacterium]|nr:HNH endonuclease [Acidimicrobiaceae bacterium]